MDHIWLAPSRYKKSPDLKLVSQWSSAITSLKDPILLNIRPNSGPNSHRKSDLYQTWDPRKSDLLPLEESKIFKVVLKNYFPFTFNFEHSLWCIAIENHQLSSLTASILSQKKDIKSKWNRLFGLCVVLKVQKRTKADFFKQKRTHFRG